MKKHLYLTIAVLIACHLFSCKKFLDKKADARLTVPISLSDLQGMLDDALYMNNRVTPSLPETSADDYYLTTATYKSTFYEKDQRAYTWQLKNFPNYKFDNDWSHGYLAIYNTNYCLEQIQKIDRRASDQNLWNYVYGASSFFRAFHYLNLAWAFCKVYDKASYEHDLGLPLRTHTDFNEPSRRSDVKSTYEQILKDARTAIEYLPDGSAHPLRPNKAAAYALLARCFLSMREYDSTYKYADLCLNLKNTLMNYNNDEQIRPTSTSPFTKYNKETIFYSEMTVSFYCHSPFYSYIDSNLIKQYSATDRRKTLFFSVSAGRYALKSGYSASRNYLFSGITTSEVLLMRAESAARTGKESVAMADISNLLANRYTTGSLPLYEGLSQQQLLALILMERRKELLMRGLRWQDIKRLNKEGQNISIVRNIDGQQFKLEPNEDRFALPIPTDIIDAAGLEQN